MNRLQSFGTIHAEKVSQGGRRQHITSIPLNHDVVDLVQSFQSLLCTVDSSVQDASVQDARPFKTHSQVPNVYDAMCSNGCHSSYFAHAMDDGGECRTWEYRTGFVAGKRGRATKASSISGER